MRTEPIPSRAEQKAQALRCGCRGSDDYCCCQNVPDRVTRQYRAAERIAVVLASTVLEQSAA
jgi:hypothetical protein